jgi:hypothetical protein
MRRWDMQDAVLAVAIVAVLFGGEIQSRLGDRVQLFLLSVSIVNAQMGL